MQRNLIRILCLALILTLCFPMVACDALGERFGQMILNLFNGDIIEFPDHELLETLLPETMLPETMIPDIEFTEPPVPDTEIFETTVPETEIPETKPPKTEPPVIEPPVIEPDPAIVHLSFDDLNLWIGDTMTGMCFTPGHSATWDRMAYVEDYNVEYLEYRGWVAFFAEEAGTFGYQIDSNEPVYSQEFVMAPEQAVIDASLSIGGKSAARMNIMIPVRDLSGEHLIRTFVMDAHGTVEVLTEFTLNKAEDPYAPIVFKGKWHASVDSFMYCVNDDYSDVVNFMAANTNSVIGTTMTGADSTLSSITANYVYWENGWLAVDGYALENRVCNIYAADGTLLKTVGLTLREAEQGVVQHVSRNMRYADGTVAHRVGQADSEIISLKEFSGQTVSLVYSVDLVGKRCTLDLVKIDVTVPEAEKPEVPEIPTNPTGTLEAPLTVSQTYAAVAGLEEGYATATPYFTTGVVTEIGQGGVYYKNVYITDGIETMLVYSLNPKEGMAELKVGDTITVHGYIKNYKGLIEFAANRIDDEVHNVYIVAHEPAALEEPAPQALTLGDNTIYSVMNCSGWSDTIMYPFTAPQKGTYTFTLSPIKGSGSMFYFGHPTYGFCESGAVTLSLEKGQTIEIGVCADVRMEDLVNATEDIVYTLNLAVTQH